MPAWVFILFGLLAGGSFGPVVQPPGGGLPQEAQNYLRGAGRFFGVAQEEVAILTDWGLPVEEIPVVLFVSHAAGVSLDAVASLRGSGRSWSSLVTPYGLTPRVFHVELAISPEDPVLASAYDKFRGRPRSGWGSIVLEDAEITALVNLRFISGQTGHSTAEIAEMRSRGASYVRIYNQLAAGGIRGAHP